MKQITALFASALLSVSAFTSCLPGELPVPADPGNPGAQQPDPQPDTPVYHKYECVTGEYIIDTAAIGGGFGNDMVIYVSTMIPYDLGRRYDSMIKYVIHQDGMTGYNMYYECAKEVTTYLDAALQHDYPQYYQYRVDRGATYTGADIPTIMYCNEDERREALAR